MAADDHFNDQQLGHYKVDFKTPGGGYLHHEVDAPDGHTAHRMASLQLRAKGHSKQIGKWSSTTQRT